MSQKHRADVVVGAEASPATGESSAKINALTGMRFFAAFGIVIYHWWLASFSTLLPLVGHAQPLISTLRLGVDFFFALSGVVLAITYAKKIGPKPGGRAVGKYIVARFARIYPLYLFLMLVGGALLWFEQSHWGTTPPAPLTWGSAIKQIFMVQVWSSPDATVTSWVNPAWSLSVEWLAYLAFPVLIFILWRFRNHSLVLAACAVIAVVPMLVATWDHGSVYQFDWSWIFRIACNFTGGVAVGLLSMRVRQAIRTEKHRRWRMAADLGILLVLAAAIAFLEIAPGPRRDLVVALILPLLFLGSIGEGPVTRILGSRWLVLGGELSYALYLVHGPMDGIYAASFHPLGFANRWFTAGEAAVGLACIPLAWVLMKFVEHPARKAILGAARVRAGRALTATAD